MLHLENSLNELLDVSAQNNKLSGYDCSVYHHHKEIYRRTVGFSNIERKIPLSKDTAYHIYSNTKVISCAAALQLYEKGKFLLEDHIGRYFPVMEKMTVKTPTGLQEAQNPITIRDLFCMTAGIGGGMMTPELGLRVHREVGEHARPIDLIPYLAEIPLEFEPGTGYYYGICHEVLAALIEKIADQPFSEYLKEHIFVPLGMEHTSFDEQHFAPDTIACHYQYNGPDEKPSNLGSKNCLIPPLLKESASGGLISTVDDYMKFQEALCTGDVILRKRTIHLMRLNQLQGTQWDGYGYTHLGMGYGLGVRTIVDQAKCGSPAGFGSFGWGGAAGSYGSIDPENELTFFYMQQMFGVDDLHTHHALRNIIYSAI